MCITTISFNETTPNVYNYDTNDKTTLKVHMDKPNLTRSPHTWQTHGVRNYMTNYPRSKKHPTVKGKETKNQPRHEEELMISMCKHMACETTWRTIHAPRDLQPPTERKRENNQDTKKS